MECKKQKVYSGVFHILCHSFVFRPISHQGQHSCEMWKARYTLFTNNDEKGTNRQNSCETWIVCREWFVRFVNVLQKTLLRNAFARVGGFLTNSKNFLVGTHICKNCVLCWIVCRPLFITFRKTQFFSRKSSFVIVCEQRRIVCSGL